MGSISERAAADLENAYREGKGPSWAAEAARAVCRIRAVVADQHRGRNARGASALGIGRVKVSSTLPGSPQNVLGPAIRLAIDAPLSLLTQRWHDIGKVKGAVAIITFRQRPTRPNLYSGAGFHKALLLSKVVRPVHQDSRPRTSS